MGFALGLMLESLVLAVLNTRYKYLNTGLTNNLSAFFEAETLGHTEETGKQLLPDKPFAAALATCLYRNFQTHLPLLHS